MLQYVHKEIASRGCWGALCWQRVLSWFRLNSVVEMHAGCRTLSESFETIFYSQPGCDARVFRVCSDSLLLKHRRHWAEQGRDGWIFAEPDADRILKDGDVLRYLGPFCRQGFKVSRDNYMAKRECP